MIWRHDRTELARSYTRPDGALVLEGIAAKPGILVYQEGGREIRELVTAETLARSAQGLRNAAVTLNHPSAGVHTGNAREVAHGDVADVELVQGRVKVTIVLRSDDAIRTVKGGVVGLSPGYGVQLGPGGVHPEFGRYDREQVSRTYNHLSVVEHPRCGAECRLRADSAERRGPSAASRARARDAFEAGRVSLGLVEDHERVDRAEPPRPVRRGPGALSLERSRRAFEEG